LITQSPRATEASTIVIENKIDNDK
jgi:hypothetical protein